MTMPTVEFPTGWYHLESGKRMLGVHAQLFDEMRAKDAKYAGWKDRKLVDHLFRTGWLRVAKDGIHAHEATSLSEVKNFLLDFCTENDLISVDLQLWKHHGGILRVREILDANDWNDVAIALR